MAINMSKNNQKQAPKVKQTIYGPKFNNIIKTVVRTFGPGQYSINFLFDRGLEELFGDDMMDAEMANEIMYDITENLVIGTRDSDIIIEHVAGQDGGWDNVWNIVEKDKVTSKQKQQILENEVFDLKETVSNLEQLVSSKINDLVKNDETINERINNIIKHFEKENINHKNEIFEKMRTYVTKTVKSESKAEYVELRLRELENKIGDVAIIAGKSNQKDLDLKELIFVELENVLDFGTKPLTGTTAFEWAIENASQKLPLEILVLIKEELFDYFNELIKVNENSDFKGVTVSFDKLDVELYGYKIRGTYSDVSRFICQMFDTSKLERKQNINKEISISENKCLNLNPTFGGIVNMGNNIPLKKQNPNTIEKVTYSGFAILEQRVLNNALNKISSQLRKTDFLNVSIGLAKIDRRNISLLDFLDFVKINEDHSAIEFIVDYSDYEDKINAIVHILSLKY